MSDPPHASKAKTPRQTLGINNESKNRKKEGVVPGCTPRNNALKLLQFYIIVFFHVEKADDIDGIEDDSIYEYIIVFF